MNIIEEILIMYDSTKFTQEGKQLFLDESKKLLDNYIDERFKLNFISSSLLLKDRYTPEFEDWLQYQQKDIKFDKYILNDTYLSKEQMFEYWESDKNNL